MVRKKLISVALAAVFASTLATPAFADTEADLAAAQSAQDQAQSAYDASESQIASMQSEQSDLQSYLTDLNSQLDSLSQSLSDLDTKISDKSSEIEITKGSVERAKLDRDNQYAAMKSRIQYYRGPPRVEEPGFIFE